MSKCIFITATGTDIGKTYISGLITKKMNEVGLNCGYYKPILSGAVNQNGHIIPGDCKHVIDTAHLECEPADCLSYCFEEAVSPHLAAERLGIKIDKTKILKDFEAKKQKYEYLLIEGAGGITCPINIEDNYLMHDLIKDMQTSVIIVADAGLGTINSVLLTVEYIKNRNIQIEGVILNNYEDTFMCKDNKKIIEKMTGIRILTEVKHNDSDIEIDTNIFKEV